MTRFTAGAILGVGASIMAVSIVSDPYVFETYFVLGGYLFLALTMAKITIKNK